MPPENEVPTTQTEVPAETPSLIEAAAVAPAEPTSPETPPAETAPKPEPTPEFVFKEEDFKAPEGFIVDPAAKAAFIELANEFKISPEAAERLVGLQAKLAKDGAEAQTKAWTDMQMEWRGAVETDPNIGGDKLPGVLSNVAKLVDKYGSDDFKQVMTLTGAGNNIHVVNFLHNIAKELVEASPVVGAPVSSPATLADSLFTTMKKG
jgi:hypothetical protein